MSRIVNYTVLKTDSTDALTRFVGAYLEKGWQPFGGVSIATLDDSSFSSKVIFAQAMVKYE